MAIQSNGVHFTVHDAQGNILRMGTVDTASLHLQANKPGEHVIESHHEIEQEMRLAACDGKPHTHKVNMDLHPALRKGKFAFVRR